MAERGLDEEEASVRGYIGIDFGTSNSHFAYANLGRHLRAEPIRLSGGEDSIPSCILLREPGEDERDILSIGGMAIEGWVEALEDGRKDLRFSAGFKPDILQSERAADDAYRYPYGSDDRHTVLERQFPGYRPRQRRRGG